MNNGVINGVLITKSRIYGKSGTATGGADAVSFVGGIVGQQDGGYIVNCIRDEEMYLCRCTTMKQKKYFNCSTYRKKSKHFCSSHQITVEAIEHLVLTDLQRVLYAYQADENRFVELLHKQFSNATQIKRKEWHSKYCYATLSRE